MSEMPQKDLSYGRLLKFELRGLVLNCLPSSTDMDYIAGHPDVERFAQRWGLRPRGVAAAIINQRKETAIG